MEALLWMILLVLNFVSLTLAEEWPIDPNGYIFFCLCMGRFGNQAEHFLGGLGFSKSINRTLVIPPFRSYKNVPFDTWFKEDALAKYHKVILADDFMRNIAPQIWPKDKRIGFCFSFPNQVQCNMVDGLQGNPFKNFWDELDVKFVDTVVYSTGYQNPDRWPILYPADKYPVIALRGAPAGFPMNPLHIPLQKYLQFSDDLMHEAEDLLHKHFGNMERNYLSVHLRHGSDWEKACEKIPSPSISKFMASYQCQGTDYNIPLTHEMCIPPQETVIDLIERVVKEEKLTKILIATDKYSWVHEIQERLGSEVTVVHPDPHNPLIDIVLLSEGKHFIGNCVSSFSAFVARHRKSHEKGKTSYCALD